MQQAGNVFPIIAVVGRRSNADLYLPSQHCATISQPLILAEMKCYVLSASIFVPLLIGSIYFNVLHPTSWSAFSCEKQDLAQCLATLLGVEGNGKGSEILYGPNITSCNQVSYTDADVPIHCCPPSPYAEEKIKDFVLPDLSSTPIRVRRPAHLVINDTEYVAKYERAVAIMKQLPFSNPHNFMRQANVHCIYCTGSYDQVNSDHLFKVHRSWIFFPWHRAFVYFHERILGRLMGDDTFALPYWQWDHPDGMSIPDIYRYGSLNHRDRGAPHLIQGIVADDNYVKGSERGLSSDEQIQYNLAFMYTQMVSGASIPELFMGCRLHPGEEDMCDAPGTIESAPHNALHDWMGNLLNYEGEDMGAFYSAARDPIFYAHHSEIDRMWMVWKQLRGNKLEFDDERWLDTVFYLYDENLVLNRIRVRDFLDISKLGYRYEEAELPWLDARPQPVVDPNTARNKIKLWKSKRIVPSAADLGEQGFVLNSTFTVEVKRNPQQRSKNYFWQKPKGGEEEVLVVHGIEAKDNTWYKFSVYINAVDQDAVLAAGPRAREFAGTYLRIRKGVKIVRENADVMRGEWKVGISELLRDLKVEDGESIFVTFVPEGDTSQKSLVIGGLRIEYLSW